MPERLLISAREAALLLGIGRDTAYALIREGRLPALRIGRRILVPKAALEQWVLDQAQTTTPHAHAA
jgi:excisionase family DNA binding protein